MAHSRYTVPQVLVYCELSEYNRMASANPNLILIEEHDAVYGVIRQMAGNPPKREVNIN